MHLDYYVKHPSQCTPAEIETYCNLLLKGGHVSPVGLKEDVLRCERLGMCFFKETMVGIIGLKNLLEEDRRYIFKSCEVEQLAEQYIYELGYGYTEPDFRGRRILNHLGDLVMANLPKGVYGTTSVPVVKHMLKRLNFTKVGMPYKGRYFQAEERELFIRPKP